MKILVLGGTQFVGRHIVEHLVRAQHAVTMLNRGQTADALPAQVERLHADRDDGASALGALKGRAWDACIDVSGYTPRQVRASAEALRPAVGRYVFISAVSVYGDPQRRPVVETEPRVKPAREDTTEVDGSTYGSLKVACEDIVREVFGERATLLRPQIVVGPHDWIGGYTRWVQRASQGGEMLAPGDGSDHLQVLDVHDLARFVRIVVETGVGGAFNLAGPRLTWADFIGLLGAERIVWVPAHILAEAGLTFNELPLFRPERGARSSLMDVNSARALAAGLTLTDPQETANRVRAWSLGHVPIDALTPEHEAALIAQVRDASRHS